MKKKTTEQFVTQAQEIHGTELYDYSNTYYINTRKKVSIRCNRCLDDFQILASNHIDKSQKQGCKKCNSKDSIKSITKTTSEFINQSKIIHDNKYDYSLVEYTNNKKKIKIICPMHGEFSQTPNHHLRGRGCNQCGIGIRSLLVQEKESNWSFKGWEKNGMSSKIFIAFSVYIIECWSDTERFIKIGKTFSGADKRFTKVNMPYEWKLIKEHTGSAKYISELEHTLHKQFKEHKYIPEQLFYGRTECFNIHIKDTCVSTY